VAGGNGERPDPFEEADEEALDQALQAIELLYFDEGARDGSFPVVSWIGSKVVGPDFNQKALVKPRSWWWCRVEDKGTYYLAHPLRQFDVEDLLRARPDLVGRLFPHLEKPGNGGPPAPTPVAPVQAPRTVLSPSPVGFVTLPRVEHVEVGDEALRLQGAADLLGGAAACELLADPARKAIALRPAEGARHAWPVEAGALRSAEPARLLGTGPAVARWSDRWGVLIVTRGLA
jgi:hypothetical protein